MCFPWMGKCSKQHFGVPNVRLIAMVERSCKSRIIIQIDKSLSRAAVDNCVKQYHSDLLLRHQELCPWYNIHGSENLTNPLLLPRSQLLTDFESRLASFETSSVVPFGFFVLTDRISEWISILLLSILLAFYLYSSRPTCKKWAFPKRRARNRATVSLLTFCSLYSDGSNPIRTNWNVANAVVEPACGTIRPLCIPL